MSSSLNVSLTDELRSFVNSRASDADVYAAPSEYIRDLIRQDMENRRIVSHVINGLDDVKIGRFSEKVILEIGSEKKARAVVQSIQEHEQTQETLALLKILAMGEQEISDGKTIPSEEVFSGAEKLIDNSYPGYK